MANEEWTQNTPIGERMMMSIRRLTRRLDPSRPVTTANNTGEMWGTASSRHLDVQGCNYCPEAYDSYHEKYPNQPMIATETSSRVTTRGIYAHDPGRGHVSAYDREVCDFFQGRMPAEAMWRGVAARRFISGAFVWTGIDYKGESGPYHWPTVSSHFGMLDSCCFPKDIAYYFRAWWTDTSDLHVFPHWNWRGHEGEIIDVWCYGRLEKVELFLNDESLGIRDMPELGHVSWKVRYSPGYIEAKGIQGGEITAVKRIETTEEPSALSMTTAHLEIRADGEDVAVVDVAVVDEKGRTVPTADNPISFEVNGPGRIIGVGNGNPSSHEPDKASARKAFNGLCQVLIQATTTPGEIIVKAKSPSLSAGTLRIAAKICRVRPSV
jgi:beta-galactosidase